MQQDPDKRPGIDEVVLRLQLLYGQIRDDIDTIVDNIFVDAVLPQETIEKICNRAAKDILSAKHIFKRAEADELEKYNASYAMTTND